MQSQIVVTLFPPATVAAMDKVFRKMGFTSRSELIRAAVKTQLEAAGHA